MINCWTKTKITSTITTIPISIIRLHILKDKNKYQNNENNKNKSNNIVTV